MKHNRYQLLLILGITGLLISHTGSDEQFYDELETENSYYDIATQINIDAETFVYNENNPTWLTIFVHGTFLVNPRLLFGALAPLVTNSIQNTMYARTLIFARKHPVFYQNQPMQELGLQKIMPHMIKQGYASGATARLFDYISELSSEEQANNYYYTFGWSGLISSSLRAQEAQLFYDQLGQEIHHFKEKGITPHVRIIAYSHGGNVALDLGLVSNIYQFSVDELILLGTPIIAETEDFIYCPLFKKIYNIFSDADHIQPLDFFSRLRSFSKRTFTPKQEEPLPEKLTQIRLNMTTSKTLACSGNVPLRFRRKKSPGHFEFWFFGWTPHYYRDTFPFYPLPMLVYLPWILDAVEQSTSKSICSQLLTVSINPTKEIMTIANKYSCFARYYPFLSSAVQEQLKQMIAPYRPPHYSAKYLEQKKKSYEKALAVHRFTKRPFFWDVEMDLKI